MIERKNPTGYRSLGSELDLKEEDVWHRVFFVFTFSVAARHRERERLPFQAGLSAGVL
jgi:hypothetical protein